MVVVAQLVQRYLPIQEFHGSNRVIRNVYCLVGIEVPRKNKEKIDH